MIYANHLAAKVAARNRVNAMAREYTPKLRAVLARWIGKKVLNNGAVVSERVKAELRAAIPPNTQTEQVFLRGGMFEVRADFRVCVSYVGNSRGDTFAAYAETSTGLGGLQRDANGVRATAILGEVKPFEPEAASWRSDYTEAEIVAARREIETAQDALDQAKSKVCGFGEHDN